jgi:hypothetical protein
MMALNGLAVVDFVELFVVVVGLLPLGLNWLGLVAVGLVEPPLNPPRVMKEMTSIKNFDDQF